MPLIKYRDTAFRPASLDIIEKANKIIDEYEALGFDLTLRQLYYQFVARGFVPNTPRSYQNLGNVINDARLAGLIDWNHITDRTRNLRSLSHWSSPSSIISACASQYRVDLWETQPFYVECWIEKDALVGVIENVCNEYDLPHFSCRGYTSQSEMWAAAQRFRDMMRKRKQCVLLHLGDHDPSGIDMTRDINDRLSLFGARVDVRRLALNFDQIEEFNPPPNPAKTTDARAAAYIAEHGEESWELDALDPTTLVGLVRDELLELIEADPWSEKQGEQQQARNALSLISENFHDVQEWARDRFGDEA